MGQIRYEYFHYIFTYPQPNILVKPTPTSCACGYPPHFVLRRGLPRALGFAKKMVATPQQRLPLWRAFSEFFLDTELDAVSFEYVAREIRASGLSLAEAESVLWNEVFPVLAQNLLDLAGVWAGWPDDWLLKHVRVENHAAPRKTGDRSVVPEISRCWDAAQSVYQSAQT